MLPPYLTGKCRSGDSDFDHVVFVTTVRSLALNYAISCGGWLYEVNPTLPVVPSFCAGSGRPERTWPNDCPC